MHLDKAKENIIDIIFARASARTPDSINALMIGIAAIERIQHQRTLSKASFQPLLKGETIGKV